MSNGNMMLTGERVRIRYWQSRDDVAQRGWPSYSDPLHPLWNVPRPTSVSVYDNLFPGGKTYTRRVWAIENIYDILIGRLSLRDIETQIYRARLGISLAAPYVGQGLGTEAMILFLDYFFGTLGFQIMVLDVATFNERAVRCYEHLGFRSVSSEWRKSGCTSCLRALEDPSHEHLKPYFRRERSMVWVQFLEMELTRNMWIERDEMAHERRV